MFFPTGDIGGQMGLFIGASILTILEIFDYLYEVKGLKSNKKSCACSSPRLTQTRQISADSFLHSLTLTKNVDSDGTSLYFSLSLRPHLPSKPLELNFYFEHMSNWVYIMSFKLSLPT